MPTRILLATSLLSIGLLHAQPPPSIDDPAKLIPALNQALKEDDPAAFQNLLDSDVDLRRDSEKVAKGPLAVQRALKNPRIWSELGPAHLENETIRRVTPDTVLIDANFTQIGTMALKRIQRLLLIAKRENGAWRIVSMRFTPRRPEILVR
jgi:uncharacterized protein DUF4440